MARYNKRPAPVDACFLDDRDPKRARFGIPPFPDARATLPKSLHSSFSAQYALADVPSSGKGLEHPTASRIRPSEDEQDRDFSQADEDSEQRTKLTPVIQTRLEEIEQYTNRLTGHFCEMIIQELDGYHGAKAHNTTMAVDIVEHCAKLARNGRSDLRHEKYVIWKASELCFPGRRGEPEMSASDGQAAEIDGGTSVDTNVYRDAIAVHTGTDAAQLGKASIRTLQPHPYDQSFTTRSYSHQPQINRYEFERDLPPRTSTFGVASSSTVSRVKHGRSASDVGLGKEGQRRSGGLLLADLLNP